MSKIDEIMGAVGRHGDDCIRDADAASESFEALRDLISAALADAERAGAEAMREAAAAEFDRRDGGTGIGFYDPHEPAEIIRALPLPTGERQAVLLTDEQIARALHAATGDPEDGVDFSAWARHPDGAEFLKLSRVVEALSLDANNLEVRRG